MVVVETLVILQPHLLLEQQEPQVQLILAEVVELVLYFIQEVAHQDVLLVMQEPQEDRVLQQLKN